MNAPSPINVPSRRTFLRGAAAAAPTVAIGGVAVGEALAASPLPPPRFIDPGPNYSRAVVFGGLAHVAGVLGVKPGTRELASPDFEPQARQALENLKASIEAAGSKLERVVKCNCFLTEASDFAAFNTVYNTFFKTNPPARSTVIVKALVLDGAKVEIDCIAAI
jgi:2-iminobutanoate/2-iminopropanoate deaminase